MKNLCPSYLIDKEIKKIEDSKFTTKENTNIIHNNKSISYYKLPYIGSYSNSISIAGRTSFKRLFASCSEVFFVYKFTCAGCQSCYIGETKRYLETTFREHLQTGAKSHILQHRNENLNCIDLCHDSFIIINHSSSSCRSKLKEKLRITWLKLVLNTLKNHVSITFRYNVRYFTL